MSGGKANGWAEDPPTGRLDAELHKLLADLRKAPPRRDLLVLTERLKAALAERAPGDTLQ